MNRIQRIAAAAAISAAVIAPATLVAALAVSPAAARPDPGGPIPVRFSIYEQNCPLRRIDSQVVRCDHLTGAGVQAPIGVPEY